MDIEIDFEKNLEENASSYFEKSKAAKKKLIGLKKAMIDLEKKALNHPLVNDVIELFDGKVEGVTRLGGKL